MRVVYLFVFAIILMSCKNNKKDTETKSTEKTVVNDSLIYPEEIHFKSLRQVTFGHGSWAGPAWFIIL